MALNDILNQRDYQRYASRRFFEELTSGRLEPEQAMEMAAELGIDLEGPRYAVLLLTIPTEGIDGAAGRVRTGLLGHLLKYPAYLTFPWEPNALAVLVKGGGDDPEQFIQRCISVAKDLWRHVPGHAWHIVAGMTADGLAGIPASFQQAARLWACRYLLPQEHVLTAATAGHLLEPEKDVVLPVLDLDQTGPDVLLDFLNRGTETDVPAFVAEYLCKFATAQPSGVLGHYLMLNARFSAQCFVRDRGLSQGALLERLDCLALPDRRPNPGEVRAYLTGAISAAIALRDAASSAPRRGPLGRAMDYVDEHFSQPGLSLEQVAAHAELSPSYLSALFRRELGVTFTDYLTEKRMERARALLHSTDRRSGEVALAVGYKDPHYFSALFKKTQGCTPRAFRAGRGGGASRL